MPNIIRIGTRDSELALWQAKIVKSQLEHLGHKTTLVPIKSNGDLQLNKPIYELGITGVFTKTLDIALLNQEIDIAVHSLKDVPTVLPKGIVQAAVIKRGNVRDTLVFKKNEEFLSQKEAVIATGSLRRKAQWLNRYPTHTIVDLRGNVNTRLQKLEDSNTWNAAIFAAAGLGRLNLRPEEAINLDWMVPAPAQGAIGITALKTDKKITAICAEINHEETEICTTIERQFLNKLEGGCTAPIGALAYIKSEEVFFKGILLNEDGTKKIEVSKTAKLGNHNDMARYCADYIIERGGKRLIRKVASNKGTKIFSTKTLTESQKALFKNDISVKSSDFIRINLNRIGAHILKKPIKNVIITSKNAVEAIVTNFPENALQFQNIYCVGRRTKRLVENKIGPVKHTEKNAKKLADYLVENIEGTAVTYFCSNLRLDELPKILSNNNIEVNEIEAYKTEYASKQVDNEVEGVLFYSPSTVKSYMQQNKANKIAYCIGETTAKEAKKYFKDIRIAKLPTVESVIERVNLDYV